MSTEQDRLARLKQNLALITKHENNLNKIPVAEEGWPRILDLPFARVAMEKPDENGEMEVTITPSKAIKVITLTGETNAE